jgi:hypothetical protein
MISPQYLKETPPPDTLKGDHGFHLGDQEHTNPPLTPSSFAPLRLCANHSLHPGTFDNTLFHNSNTPNTMGVWNDCAPNPFIPVKSFLAQRRKDAKFPRIKKSQIFGKTA